MSNPYPPDPSGQPRPSDDYTPYQPPTYPQYNQPMPNTSGSYPYQPQQNYQQYPQSQPGYGPPAASQSQPNIIINMQQGVSQPMAQPLLVAVSAPVNGKATAAMILGLCSFIAWFLTGIPAVILGHMALNEIHASRGTQAGQGQAITGLILGYLAAGSFALCIVCYFAGALASFGASPH